MSYCYLLCHSFLPQHLRLEENSLYNQIGFAAAIDDCEETWPEDSELLLHGAMLKPVTEPELTGIYQQQAAALCCLPLSMLPKRHYWKFSLPRREGLSHFFIFSITLLLPLRLCLIADEEYGC